MPDERGLLTSRLLVFGSGSAERKIDEMSGAATTFSRRRMAGAHPLWVLGHLTLVEGHDPGGTFSETRIRWQSGKQYFGEESKSPSPMLARIHPSPRVRKKYLQFARNRT